MTAITLEVPTNDDDLLNVSEADAEARRVITALLNSSNLGRTIDVNRFVTNKPNELTYDELLEVAKGPESRRIKLANGEESYELKGFSEHWTPTYYPSNRLPKTNDKGQYASHSTFKDSKGGTAPNWGRTGRRHLLYDVVQWAVRKYGVKGWINIARLSAEVAHMGFSPGYLYAMIRDLELRTHSTILYMDGEVSYREQIRRMVQKYSDTNHGPPGISNSEIRNVAEVEPPLAWNTSLRAQGSPGASVGGPGRGRRLEDRSLRKYNIRQGQTKRMKKNTSKGHVKTVVVDDIQPKVEENKPAVSAPFDYVLPQVNAQVNTPVVDNFVIVSPKGSSSLEELKFLLRLSEAMEDVFLMEGRTDINPAVLDEAINLGRRSAEEKLKLRKAKAI